MLLYTCLLLVSFHQCPDHVSDPDDLTTEMSEFKSKISLPPASNWFSANILAAGPGGWVAWGAKNGLVLLRDNDNDDDSDNDSDYPRVISHTEAHGERCKVTGVSVDQSEASILCDSQSEAFISRWPGAQSRAGRAGTGRSSHPGPRTAW